MGARCTFARIRSWASGPVHVRWQGTCGRTGNAASSVAWLNGTGRASPCCSSIRSKCRLFASSRGGVPVFRRPSSRPSAATSPERPSAERSPTRPPAACCSPVCMTARRKVPVVMTTAPAASSRPSSRRTPSTPGAVPAPSSSRPATPPSTSSTPAWASTSAVAASRYRCRSDWHRGARTAAPLPVLSMRNWIPVASATRPMAPPRASTSRTSWPLPRPPMAGLQLISPTLARSKLTSATRAPSRPAASAASTPAWPPPTTTTSHRRSGSGRGRACGWVAIPPLEPPAPPAVSRARPRAGTRGRTATSWTRPTAPQALLSATCARPSSPHCSHWCRRPSALPVRRRRVSASGSRRCAPRPRPPWPQRPRRWRGTSRGSSPWRPPRARPST